MLTSWPLIIKLVVALSKGTYDQSSEFQPLQWSHCHLITISDVPCLLPTNISGEADSKLEVTAVYASTLNICNLDCQPGLPELTMLSDTVTGGHSLWLCCLVMAVPVSTVVATGNYLYFFSRFVSNVMPQWIMLSSPALQELGKSLITSWIVMPLCQFWIPIVLYVVGLSRGLHNIQCITCTQIISNSWWLTVGNKLI